MFILGLGLGMAVSSLGGAVVLYLENRHNKNKPQEEAKHFHITIDEDANLPDFFREQLLKKPIDWTKSFPEEAETKNDQKDKRAADTQPAKRNKNRLTKEG